jgi:hypothetical protein
VRRKDAEIETLLQNADASGSYGILNLLASKA